MEGVGELLYCIFAANILFTQIGERVHILDT
jgi:hypothetical protein